MKDLTQNETVLKHLKSGQPITPKDAYRLYGIMRLAARIHDLRARGNEVKERRTKADGRWFSTYSMTVAGRPETLFDLPSRGRPE